MMLRTLLLLAIGCAAAHLAHAVTEYVAMAPGGGATGPDVSAHGQLEGPRRLQPTLPNPLVKWTELRYYPNVSSVEQVSFKLLNETVPELGAWFDLDLSKGGGGGVSLSAKIIKDKMYAYIEKKPVAGASGGCCADTLRIYSRETGNFTEIDLRTIVAGVFPPSVKFHEASHTFDVQEEGGVVYAYLMVQYSAPELGGALANACVAISTVDGSVRKTVEGDAYFSFVEKIGVVGANASLADTIFKMQYYKVSDEEGASTEEWHGNGMLRLTTRAGTKLLVITHRFGSEAVLMKDPYSYSAADGGGAILQRFGTPKHFTGVPSGLTYHRFGVPATTPPWTGGVHNIFYNAVSKSTATLGLETLSLFINSVQGKSTSFAYEFAIKLTPQKAGTQYTERVFDTAHLSAACSFEAQAQGGARAIGNGVFVVADGDSGSVGGMLQVVDAQGGHKSVRYPAESVSANLYDPFTRVVKVV